MSNGLRKAGWRMWHRIKDYLLVLPAIALTGVLFFGGLIDGLFKSFGYFPAVGNLTFSLQAYQDVVTSPLFRDSLVLTIRVAILSTISATVLGVGAALALYFMARRTSARWLLRLFQLPLTIPHLAAGYFMILLLSQSGLLARFAYAFGWIDAPSEFPVVVNDRFGLGMILTYSWKEAPFIALLVYPVLARIHDNWLDAAKVYGATTTHYIWHILLPAIRPAVITASLIVFIYTLSSFEVPYLLGVTYPSTLPVYAFQLYTSGSFADRSEALVIMWLLTTAALVVGLVAYRFYRKSYERGWE